MPAKKASPKAHASKGSNKRPAPRAIAAKTAPKGKDVAKARVKMPEAKGKAAGKAQSGKTAATAGGAIGSLKKMLGLAGGKAAEAAPAKGAKGAAGKGAPMKGAAALKGGAPGAKGTAAATKGVMPPAAKGAAPAAKGVKNAPATAPAGAPKRGRAAKGVISDMPRTSLATSLRPQKPESEALPHGAPVCREVACELMATTGGYCRMHYIKNWKKIKRKEIILKEKKLNHYIEELVSKYPDKYIEAIRQDLASEKDFAKVIADLEIDEGLDDFESVDTESAEGIIDNIKREFDDDGDVF